MKMIHKLNFLALAIVIALASCSGGGNETAENSDSALTKVKKYSVEYPLPTPFEITQMLDKAGASYIFDMSNSSENVGKYLTEKAQAVNLGVYGADLSYAATYKRMQEAQIYMNCSRQLTEELGITGVFDETIIKKIETNFENNDSLHVLISDTFYGTFDYLNSNNKGAVSVMIMAGGFIEGMYVATQIYYTATDTKQVIEGISSQKAVVEQLVTLMENYKENTAVVEVLAEVNKIKAVYDKLEQNKVLSDAQMKELAKVVEQIRKGLI